MNSPTLFLLAAVTILPSLSSRSAEPKNTADTFLDEKSAGMDYQLQGEYVGTAASAKLAAQVVALGNSQFRAVFHNGGLPGAGWDGKAKTEIEGNADGETVTFESAGSVGTSGKVSKGEFKGRTAEGAAFALKRIVRTSPAMGAKPPSGAIVLFDGGNLDSWQNAHTDERGWLAAGSKTKQLFQDFTLHVEFFLPFKPLGRGQGRGNSGVYLQDRYEVQVLDSFGLKGLNNECGGLYSQVAPSVNMCFPPLTWQTYDIEFTAARFDGDGMKTAEAVATVRHNGVMIHDHQKIKGPTGGGKKEDPSPGAIQLQGHGNPVFYRNVWIIEKNK